MKKLIIGIVVAVLVVAIGVGGFFAVKHFIIEAPEKLIVGEWENQNGTGGYEFFEDGTMKVTVLKLSSSLFSTEMSGTYDGTYSIEKDKLTMSYSYKIISTVEVTKNFTFEIKDDILTLTDLDKTNATSVVYTRVEASK